MTFGTPTKKTNTIFTVGQGEGVPDWTFTISGLTTRISNLTAKANNVIIPDEPSPEVAEDIESDELSIYNSRVAKKERLLARAAEFQALKNAAEEL